MSVKGTWAVEGMIKNKIAYKNRVIPALPHDLFHSHILPDLLSDHLHHLMVNSERPQWDPFRTLPYVSRDFSRSCHSLYYSIFGTMNDEQG